ncbi:MAG: hypothetical protein BWX57_00218 [Tenericutes bacterium ADurb.Bin024]|nr:MAG: hypothetical protein BWX57_00218 [Tenericutes bacterium ADurb.Bin024]
MKKFRTPFWLIIAVLALTSCGKKPSSEAPSEGTSTITTSRDTTESEVVTSEGPSSETGSQSEQTHFTITWKNYNSQVLEVDENVAKGTMPKYDGATPTRPADETYTYSFNGWDPEPVPVVANAIYTAKYKTTLKEVVDPRDFVFAEVGDGYTLCGYYGNASTVVIPETYNNKPVVALEQWAFYNQDNLVSVTLPNNLRKIGEDAFADCDNLKVVNFGNGVEEIALMAFDSCPSLETISLPDSVERIYAQAFANCPALTTVRMSVNIKSFSDEVFYNSPAVNYTVYENGLYLGSGTHGAHLVFVKMVDKTQATLKLHPDTRIIANRACANSSLTEVTFWGNKLHTIGYSAFANCANLTSIYLPNIVSKIEGSAFENCGLTSVTLGTGVKEIGNSAFEDCQVLETIKVPDDLEKIGLYAFYSCPKLPTTEYDYGRYLGTTTNAHLILLESTLQTMTAIEIHSDTRLIAPGALYNSSKLTTVNIPANVRFIGREAFASCYLLDSFTVDSANEYYYTPTNNKALMEKETHRLLYGLNGGYIPETTKIIGELAFKGRSLTEAITIPNSVTTIEFAAFESTRIPSVIIPDSVTKMEQSIFRYCEKLASVMLSNNLNVIDEWTFYNCESLTSISIPDSVSIIKERAFSNCNVLATVNLGAGLVFIDDVSFQSCVALNNLVFPDSLRVIRNSGFTNCQNLTSISIPKELVYIGPAAFAECPLITSITVASENRYFDDRENCNAVIEKKTNKMVVGCNVSTIPSTVVALGAYLFAGCTFESITIPATITVLENSVFNGCINLKTVVIQSAITKIANYTFNGCRALTSVNIPETVTEIGDSAFYNCSALTELKLPANLITIGSWCFGGCNKLTQIIIPASVTTIGYYAVRNCALLTIYAEATSLPEGWDENWNPSNRPVYWYSETANYDGEHWRYVSGVPTVWAE